MDNLEIAVGLIRRAQRERDRLAEYQRQMKEIEGKGWQARLETDRKFQPIPRKSVTNDALKLARRLLAESYI